MLICIHKTTGRLLESSSKQSASAQLIANALSGGHGVISESEVETLTVSQETFNALVTETASYAMKRRVAYGDLAAQLDMIYWDKINGTSLWMDHVAAVKALVPKE